MKGKNSHMSEEEQAEFNQIKCRYIDCYAGLGVAGMLHCFLGGDYKDPNCKKYQEDENL